MASLNQNYLIFITWPLGAVNAIDTIFGRSLHHILIDLDKDAPVAALLSLPRILCFPPPPGLDRSKLSTEFIHRVRRVENGGAAELHKAHNWVQLCPIGEWLPPPVNRAAESIAKSVERRSPSAGFRTITAPPSMPPTLQTMKLGLTFFPRAPNPNIELLAAEADRYLPKSPLGSGFIHDRELELKVIGDWIRHFTTHSMGMADGTGLGHLHLALPSARRLFALWFQTILDCRTTKLHRAYLRSGTFRFTAKPDKNNPDQPYPTNPDQVKAIRSIITPAARRSTAGLLASRYTNHNREIYIHHRQYGLVPSGMEAAARKCLLDTKL